MKKEVNLIAFSLNIVINLLILLSFQTVSVIDSQALQLTSLINIIFVSIYGLVLLQCIIGIIYKVELMISNQLKMVRYLLFPFFGRFFLQEGIINSSSVDILIFLLLMVSLFILTVLFIS